MDAMPAKNMPGRKAGKDHARSQCPLRGEAFVGSTLSLAAISGFTVFKRSAEFLACSGSSEVELGSWSLKIKREK